MRLSAPLIALALWPLGCSTPDAPEPGSGCPPGDLGCECGSEGACADPLVCASAEAVCRRPALCVQLDCGFGRTCQAAGSGMDAQCEDACTPGLVWDGAAQSCVADEATCDADHPRSLAPGCEALHRDCVRTAAGATCGGCVLGFTEDARGECVVRLGCDDLDCASLGRLCQDSELLDAYCARCLPGRTELDGECVAATCGQGPSGGTIKAVCDDLRRACVEDGAGATCGGCWPTDVEEEGECRRPRTCQAIGCLGRGRLCRPPSDGVDARCGDCRAGYVEVDGVCERSLIGECGGPGEGLSGACEGEGRTCVVEEGQARCGECHVGMIESPDSGVCAPIQSCDELDCAAAGRLCEPEPTAHCVGCVQGRVEDPAGGGCREISTCDQLECEQGWRCEEGDAAAGLDASCLRDCGDDALWDGQRCTPCPPCDRPGEAGRWPAPAAGGACMCRTEPGWYYRLSAGVGAYACDEDGDGWISDQADSARRSADPAVRVNARCAVRTIDRVVLENEAGDELEVALDPPLDLVESDRNDSDLLLAARRAVGGVPALYGQAGRPGARELNRFTKLCVDAGSDYNDNGAGDVREHGGAELADGFPERFTPFNRYSYFLELNTGWYDEDGRPDTGC